MAKTMDSGNLHPTPKAVEAVNGFPDRAFPDVVTDFEWLGFQLSGLQDVRPGIV